jgi:hypothetical protein
LARGNARSMDYSHFRTAFDNVIQDLDVPIIKKYDFTILVYKEYYKLSNHKMHVGKSWDGVVKRLRGILTEKMYNECGWKTVKRKNVETKKEERFIIKVN